MQHGKPHSNSLPKELARLHNIHIPIRKVPPHNGRVLAAADNAAGVKLQLEDARVDAVTGWRLQGWVVMMVMPVGGVLLGTLLWRRTLLLGLLLALLLVVRSDCSDNLLRYIGRGGDVDRHRRLACLRRCRSLESLGLLD